MRNAYVFIGIAALVVIVGGWYAANRNPVDHSSNTSSMTTKLSLTSPAFEQGSSIPSQFTCDAENISPPLLISGVPEGAKSLALLMDDPDIPQVFKDQRGIDSFDHWTLFNISPETTEIAQGGVTGVAGANGAGENAYTGPCPPAEYEPSEHRYFFRLYALDTELSLQAGAKKAEVLAAMEGHILGEAELMGRYKRITQ
jgi:hypothetical protein